VGKENRALFLGMLCGDGHLSIHTKKRKYGVYYDYCIGFCNTDKELMKVFSRLFFQLFSIQGNFHPRSRPNRKRIYEFHSYSRKVFEKILSWKFPVGIKRDALRIPNIILKGSRKEKLGFLLGVLITDGCVRKNKTILFHSGSKKFLEDLSRLINNLFGVKKGVKSYVQRKKYISYQCRSKGHMSYPNKILKSL
jgi:intein/homing endonuclease